MTQPRPKELDEAYRRWHDVQWQAVELMREAPHPGAPEDWAEGYRWVHRIAALAFDWIVEKSDPLHPVVFRNQDAYRKLIVDNPDVRYWFASLDCGERYRLSGTRGDAPYVGLTIGTDILRGAEGGRTGTLGQYDLDQFEIGPDGAFAIVLAPEQRPEDRDWIELPPGAAQVAIRETILDPRATRTATFGIERLGPAIAPPRLTPEILAERLDAAGHFVLFVVRTCLLMYQGSAGSVNRIGGGAGAEHVEKQDDEVRTHSDTDMVYMGGRFQLEPGEALRVRIRPPAEPFTYWGLVVVNPWMESYDYRFANTHTNNGLAESDPDGSGGWTIVVAPEDPGAPNWLDTGGRREGFLLLRWVFARNVPAPTCEVYRP